MTLLDEYVENSVRKAQERIIRNQLNSGMGAETADIPLSTVKAVEKIYR